MYWICIWKNSVVYFCVLWNSVMTLCALIVCVQWDINNRVHNISLILKLITSMVEMLTDTLQNAHWHSPIFETFVTGLIWSMVADRIVALFRVDADKLELVTVDLLSHWTSVRQSIDMPKHVNLYLSASTISTAICKATNSLPKDEVSTRLLLHQNRWVVIINQIPEFQCLLAKLPEWFTST